MRYSFVPMAVVLGFSAMAFSACAEGNVVTIEDAGAEDDAFTPPKVPDSGAKETGPVCVTSCSSDSECQNSCAPVSSGANCCDTGTKKCYRNANSCPAEQPDAGSDSPVGPY